MNWLKVQVEVVVYIVLMFPQKLVEPIAKSIYNLIMKLSLQLCDFIHQRSNFRFTLTVGDTTLVSNNEQDKLNWWH